MGKKLSKRKHIVALEFRAEAGYSHEKEIRKDFLEDTNCVLEEWKKFSHGKLSGQEREQKAAEVL